MGGSKGPRFHIALSTHAGPGPWPGPLPGSTESWHQSPDPRTRITGRRPALDHFLQPIGTTVVTAPPNFWASVVEWGTVGGFLSGDDAEVLRVAINFPENPTKIPTEKQSQRILAILKRLQEEGCPIELDKD